MTYSLDLDIDLDIDLNSCFASNQISNIFYLKILYASFLASHFPYINLDIIFYISVLAFFRKEVLPIIQSQGQATCLIAGLQEKITYRSTLFPFSDSKAKNTLQKKAPRDVRS